MNNLVQCPDSKTLRDYLLGTLGTLENETCELHLENCSPCVDTIRSLDVQGDTLNELTHAGFVANADKIADNSNESVVVRSLVRKMENLANPKHSIIGSSRTLLNDRTAEVYHLLKDPVVEGDIGSLGDFRIIELLGAGSTGVVYRAVDRRLERMVAIKFLRPSLGDAARERFVAEARATAAIEHANVVTIYEVGIAGPLAFISMQWLHGETLEQRLNEQENLSVEEAKRLSIEIANGLSAAHEQGLIHRDIKPANIWLPQGSEAAKILDFGLVRVTDEDPQLTCTGMIAGTPCYMSPEQSRGKQLDARSDLFSLGCVMYRALTGRLPFESDNALATLQSIQREHPPHPCELDPSIPADVSDIVMCLLEKSPGKRPPNAKATLAALQSERSQWSFPVANFTEQKKELDPKNKTQSHWWRTALITTALAIGTLGFMFHQQIARIVTNEGQIVVETKVADVQLEILENGTVVKVIDLATKKSIDIRAGQYVIRPMGTNNTIEIENNVLTLSRGETEIVKITQAESKLATSDPDQKISVDTSTFDPDTGKGTITTTVPLEANLSGGGAEESPFAIADPAESDPLDAMLTIVGWYNAGLSEEAAKIQNSVLDAMKLARENVKKNKASGEDVLDEIRTLVLESKLDLAFVDMLVRAINDEKHQLTGVRTKTVVLSKRVQLSTLATSQPHLLNSGDIVAVVANGILGSFDGPQPVHVPGRDVIMNPTTGYPMFVEEDGSFQLPYVGKINVRGMTIAQANQALKVALLGGEEPILRPYHKVSLALASRSSPVAGNAHLWKPHQLSPGNILGIYVAGLVGSMEESPPVHFPTKDSRTAPSIGYPTPVEADGTINLPMIQPIQAAGKTVDQVRNEIIAAYTKDDDPILREEQILVSLIRPFPFYIDEQAKADEK